MKNITLNKIQEALKSPHRIEDAVNFIAHQVRKSPSRAPVPMDEDAYATLVDTATSGVSHLDIMQIKSIIDTHHEPCVAVCCNGEIVAVNGMAEAALRAVPGQHIDDLDVTPAKGGPLSEVVKKVTEAFKADDNHKLIKATNREASRSLSIILTSYTSSDRDACFALICFPDIAQNPKVNAKILIEKQITSSEAEVLELFVSGQTLAQIAEIRDRSVATVRKQFYTICEKFEVSSQTDLLLYLFLNASLTPLLRVPEQVRARSKRIEAAVLRPGGRVCEVLISGSKTGRPVVVIGGILLRTFTPAVEELFAAANLQIITIMSPGLGKTSPEPRGQSLDSCQAQDIEAVLDQLGIRSAVFIAPECGFSRMLVMAKLIPDRVEHILGFSIVLPRVYCPENRGDRTFFETVQVVQGGSPLLRSLVIKAVTRAFSVLGLRGSIHLVYRNNPATINMFMQGDVIVEAENAFASVFEQGLEKAEIGYDRSQDDWSEMLHDFPVPITLLGATPTELHQLHILRSFAQKFASQIRYVELSDHHPDMVFGTAEGFISQIKSCQILSRQSQSKKGPSRGRRNPEGPNPEKGAA
jgi:DNA-binding CsgD family transcriptional regulator/pimeloyl-ACP methyl ester carboxylesterase